MEFNLADVFENVADAVPEREALICEDTRLTYAELDKRANRLAHALTKAGVNKGDHIGLYLWYGVGLLGFDGTLNLASRRPFKLNYRRLDEPYRAAEQRHVFTVTADYQLRLNVSPGGFEFVEPIENRPAHPTFFMVVMAVRIFSSTCRRFSTSLASRIL